MNSFTVNTDVLYVDEDCLSIDGIGLVERGFRPYSSNFNQAISQKINDSSVVVFRPSKEFIKHNPKVFPHPIVIKSKF